MKTKQELLNDKAMLQRELAMAKSGRRQGGRQFAGELIADLERELEMVNQQLDELPR